MPTNNLWTNSQRKAWEYVKAGESAGLSQTGALSEYRAGGGAIRTADWLELWHRYGEAAQTWDTLYQYKPGDTLPESMYSKVDVNYTSKYVMTYSTTVRDEEGNLIHDVQRQVESDRRLTLQEWTDAAVTNLLLDPSKNLTEVYDIQEVEFFTH
jgi:hypothetical protein